MHERRKQKRKEISYYICVMDSTSGQMIGHLVDVAPSGLRIDSHLQIPPGMPFLLQIELVGELTDNPLVTLATRTVWCKPDELEPNVYNIGLKVENLTPHQAQLLEKIAEQFGKRETPTYFTPSRF